MRRGHLLPSHCSGVTVQREGVAVLRGVDWRVEAGERWVDPRSERFRQDDTAAGGRRPAVADGRHGGDPRSPSRGGRRPDACGRVSPWSAARSPGNSGPTWLARDVVVSGRHGALETWWNRYTEEDWEKADALLALGGVAELGDRPFGVISEGERQQVLLARALMSDPELLLLDEPFAGLDLGARERLLVRLTALAADLGSPPIVLVTHHCEEIPPGFTHGGLVSGGELVASGPLSEVVTSERVSRPASALTVTVGCTDGRWWSRAR